MEMQLAKKYVISYLPMSHANEAINFKVVALQYAKMEHIF